MLFLRLVEYAPPFVGKAERPRVRGVASGERRQRLAGVAPRQRIAPGRLTPVGRRTAERVSAASLGVVRLRGWQ